MQETAQSAPRTWGVIKPAWFWIMSLLLGPGALAAMVLACGVVLGLVIYAPLVMLGSDERLAGTIWAMDGARTGELFTACFILGAAIGGAAILARWATRALTHIRMDDEALTCWTLSGRRRLAWGDIVRAFVTQGGGPDDNPTLHLWTRWRDLSLPMDRIADDLMTGLQREAFELFLREVRGHLAPLGISVEEDVPVSALTDAAGPVRHLLMWPHRRLLVRAMLRQSGPEPPADQRQPMASMRLAWLLRPAPLMAASVTVGALGMARWWIEHPSALALLTGAGLLLGLLIPLWNWLKELSMARRSRGALTPELLVGHDTAPEPLPELLLPARGCHVDLKGGQIGRPDGQIFPIGDVGLVEYGPPRRASTQWAGDQRAETQRAGDLRQQAWHLALGMRATPGQTREIFHNASVDIVRHGDIDAGYAVFNWITSRSIALQAGADLVLAQGRVPAAWVGQQLRERLARDVVRYDPAPLAGQVHAERPGVRIRQTPERFEAWGPLVRLPEACATPPLYKGALGLLALALIPTGFVPAGLLAGWMLVGALHDLLTARHFGRPGFMMDAEGVWVRGRCVPWESLEQSTLMPVAPGPILFAGERRVLIVGHLGATYAERAWLGCAAYQWIQSHHPERLA